LFLQSPQEEFIALIRPLDWYVAQSLPQVCCAAGVIQVTMGQPDTLNRHASLADCGKDAIHIATRIHDHRLLAVIVPQNRTVLLKWRDGNDRAAQLAHFSAPARMAGRLKGRP
jgi:hypothetical protein